MSLAVASVEDSFAVSVTIFTPRRLAASTSSISSSVSPLVEIVNRTSPAASMPRSPWRASAACRNIDGVPVLEKVAAIFRPINPDLPSPATTTRPLQEYSSSTAFSKRSSRRSIRPLMASASIWRTRFAVGTDTFLPFGEIAFFRGVIGLIGRATFYVPACAGQPWPKDPASVEGRRSRPIRE